MRIVEKMFHAETQSTKDIGLEVEASAAGDVTALIVSLTKSTLRRVCGRTSEFFNNALKQIYLPSVIAARMLSGTELPTSMGFKHTAGGGCIKD